MINLNKLFPWLSIRSKLLIAFAGLSILPLTLVGIYGIVSNVRTMKEIALENLNHDVQTIKWNTGNFLEDIESDLRVLRHSAALQRFISNRDNSPRNDIEADLLHISTDLLALAQTKGIYYQLRMVDESGDELLRIECSNETDSGSVYRVALSGELRHAGESYYFLLIDGLTQDQIAFAPAELISQNNERVPVIGFAMPLVGMKHHHGVLIANVFVKNLLQIIEGKRHLELGGKVVLATGDGHFLYHSEKKKDWNRLLAYREEDNLQHDYPSGVVNLLLSGNEGTVTEGVDEIISYSPLFSLRGHDVSKDVTASFTVPLYIFESIPKNVILGSVKTFAWTFAGLLMLFLIAAIGLGLLATQQFTKPISALQHGAEIIAKGNYGHRLHVETHDEIEKLATQFNSMAASLESHEQEIRQHRTRLEEMVRLRTRELTEEKSKLQAILDNVPSAFVLLDREFRIQTASAAFQAVTGFSIEDVRGKDCQTVFCKDGFCQECVCREALDKGGIVSHIDRTDDQGGGERFIEHIAVPMKEDGEFTSILEIITDVTKRKRLEQHIVQTEKLMAAGEMSAIIAHEFRNSLTSIKMILQLQKESRSLTRSEGKSLSVALDSIYHMEEVVAELLNFARPSPMGFRWEHVNNIVNESLALVQVHLATHHIILDKKLDLTLPAMSLDRPHLKEALVNILLNAVHAVTTGRANAGKRRISIVTKRIRVRKTLRDLTFVESSGAPSGEVQRETAREIVLRNGTECALVEISDTGPGIERDLLGRIFDPFFTTKASGTGLGLPMVKRAVNAHDGIVTVSSRPGKSTTFGILLPLRDNLRQAPRESEENAINGPPADRISTGKA
jgi:PAS domain S-box-containing protein